MNFINKAHIEEYSLMTKFPAKEKQNYSIIKFLKNKITL